MSAYYEFKLPTKILSGDGALEHIPHELEGRGASRPLLLSDQGLEQVGTVKIVQEALHQGGMDPAETFCRIPPDSSIEVVNQVAFNIIGNDVTVTMAAEAGQLELNAFEPIIFYNLIQSVETLTYAVHTFVDNCVTGITANREKMHHNLHNSLMLVTALNPYIGYDNAAKTAKKAHKDNISLKEACVELGFLTPEKFDEVFHPEEMI